MNLISRIGRLDRDIPVNVRQWAKRRAGRDGVIVLTDAEALGIAQSLAAGALSLEPTDAPDATSFDCSALSDDVAERLRAALPPELVDE